MAYEAVFNTPDSQLGNADIVIKVSTARGKLGELHISKGLLAWKPLSGRDSYKLTWIQFDRVAKQRGKGGKGT